MAEPINDPELENIERSVTVAPCNSRPQWTCRTVAKLVARIRALEAEAAEQKGIVAAIWKQLGSPSYEELAGRSIYDMIAALRERMEWRPIETAPKDGTWVLGNAGDGSVYRISWGRNRRGSLCWCTVFGSFVDGYMKFWAPLPTPPAPEGETDA